MAPTDLAVVVPAWNEEVRIGPTLLRIGEYLDACRHRAEILVVDDGSTDNTAGVVEGLAGRDRRIRLLRNPGNRGKGYSVRHGFLSASAGTVLFSDADLSTPIEEYGALEDRIAGGAAIAIGSRALPDSVILVHQPWYRETMGKTFNRIQRLLSGLPFRDTQCGFKAFRREPCLPVFRRARVDGFAFDVELLCIARSLGLRAEEVPVRWINSPASRVHPVLDSARMLRDVLRIRWLLATGAYASEAGEGG